jgi:hypothetical protein
MLKASRKKSKLEIHYFSDSRISFLSNEMGWIHNKRSGLDSLLDHPHLWQSRIKVVLIGNSLAEIKAIQGFPRSSLWILLYGDETWNPRLNKSLLKTNSLIGTIRPYPAATRSLKSLRKLYLASLRFLPRKFSFRKLLRGLTASFVVVFRQVYINILHRKYKKQSIDFLPGYTELFIDAIEAITGIGHSENSLLCSESKVTPPKKQIQFSFVGQRGGTWREFALARLRESILTKDFAYIERSSFGGTKGANGASLETAKEYVQTLLHSRFVISPPGNYSGSTFRWLETVICGAIPLQALSNPSDPDFRPPVTLPNWLNSGSWESIISSANQLSHTEFQSCSSALREEVNSFLKSVNRELIDTHVGKSRLEQ